MCVATQVKSSCPRCNTIVCGWELRERKFFPDTLVWASLVLHGSKMVDEASFRPGSSSPALDAQVRPLGRGYETGSGKMVAQTQVQGRPFIPEFGTNPPFDAPAFFCAGVSISLKFPPVSIQSPRGGAGERALDRFSGSSRKDADAGAAFYPSIWAECPSRDALVFCCVGGSFCQTSARGRFVSLRVMRACVLGRV